MSSSCACADMPRSVKVDEAAPHLRGFPLVDSKLQEWMTLVRCPDCGQHWQLDEWDKLQVILAIKVASPDEWLHWDDKECRVEYLVQSRGGLGDQACGWQGCTNEALKDMAFCPRCAYEKLGLRS